MLVNGNCVKVEFIKKISMFFFFFFVCVYIERGMSVACWRVLFSVL